MVAYISPPASPAPRWPGLLSSLGGESASTATDERWAAGFTFVPGMCGWNEELPLVACAGGSFDVDAADPGVSDALLSTALYLWSAQRRGPLCSTPEEMTAGSIARLKADLSYKLEAELWTGAARRALGVNGQYFTSVGTTVLNSGTALPFVHALGKLQKSWGACARGRRGMIHCPPDLATSWLARGSIRREGALLLDAFDNIVVAGTGYDGSGLSHTPDATGKTSYAFMTDVIGLLLGSTATAEAFDTTNNQEVVVAYRPTATFYDPCCVVGVNADLCAAYCTA